MGKESAQTRIHVLRASRFSKPVLYAGDAGATHLTQLAYHNSLFRHPPGLWLQPPALLTSALKKIEMLCHSVQVPNPTFRDEQCCSVRFVLLYRNLAVQGTVQRVRVLLVPSRSPVPRSEPL